MTDQDREAFEACLKDDILTPNTADLRRLMSGEYVDTTTSYLCKAWLAALAHRDEQIADLQRQRDEAIEAEQARWQTAIYESCVKCSGKTDLDGSGCDSGDPLDFSTTEIEMAINHVANQRDELLEAVFSVERCARIADKDCYWADITEHVIALAARIQTTQPKGEWIDIEPGGSNLPEPVAGTHYRVALRSTGNALWMEAYKLEEFFNADGFDISIAYWSIPHIDRRPDIPPYQPKEQSDG